jgi:hypothetical protein
MDGTGLTARLETDLPDRCVEARPTAKITVAAAGSMITPAISVTAAI